MELQDFLNLINSDVISNISSIFSNKSNVDVSNPYWQLPSYSTTPQQPPPKATGFDINQLLELAKLIIPLLAPKTIKKPEPKSDFHSNILSLTKIDKG